MNPKAYLLGVIALATVNTALAQDKMYKHNGDMVEVKVTEISNKTVSFKKSDNPDGPTYTIPKNDVDKIVYDNGAEETFDDDRRPMHKPMRDERKVHYGHNILSASLLQVTERGVGVGLAYERVLDKKGIVSFYMPVVAAFSTNDDQTFVGSGTGSFNNNQQINTYYVMPGLKFYPTGSKGKVRYAVGPNAVMAFGQSYVNKLVYNSSGYPIGNDIGMKDRFSLGMIVNNSLNINPTPHLYLGLEMGIGIAYLDKIDGDDNGTTGFFQFGFKVGYRF